MTDAATNDRWKRFMLVIRQACLMVAAHVERETGAPHKAIAALREGGPEAAPMQYRELTDDECRRIAEHLPVRRLLPTEVDNA